MGKTTHLSKTARVFIKNLKSNDDASKSKRRRTATEGKRFIVLHAGSIRFAEDESLVFSTKNKSTNYHDNMNSENFEKKDHSFSVITHCSK